jgi:hypothetical protein
MPIITMKGKNHEDIFIEVEEEKTKLTRGGKIDEITDKAKEYARDFSRVGDYIMIVCDDIYTKYQAAVEGVRPDALEIEFGIKISGEAGVPFVSKGSAEATIKVTAKWNSTPGGST